MGDEELRLPLLVALVPLVPEQGDCEDHRDERRRERDEPILESSQSERPEDHSEDHRHEERRTAHSKRSLVDRLKH